MSDSQVWFPRLEKVAVFEIGLSMFACLGAPEQSYNVSLGFFLLYSAYMRIGRINVSCMLLHLVSFVADVLTLAVRSDSWARSGALTSLSLSLLIMLLFVKAVALLIMTLIHSELGDGNVSVTGGIGSASYAAQMGGTNYAQVPMAGRISRSASFGAYTQQPTTPTHQATYMHPTQAAPTAHPSLSKHPSRSSSFGNMQGLGGSTRSLHGGGEPEQYISMPSAGQGQRGGISPAPQSGSFRAQPCNVPILNPPPAVAANSYQAD